MKFFDIQNKGGVTKDQFVRALTKIGLVLPEDVVRIKPAALQILFLVD